MKFLREDTGVATRAIAHAICDGLFAHKRVLWLVSGGSNVAVEKRVMDMVRDHATGHLTSLAILPIDERYGKPGHADSNMHQLQEAGFDAGEATIVDVLIHDQPFGQTVDFYNEVAATALASATVIIGQFGMGADGHIAGLKPGSPATQTDASTVAGYEWTDYMRMTLMPAALRQITTGFLLAYGADKKPMLEALRHHKKSFHSLPAVFLYEIPDVYVYNDQLESEDIT